MKYLLIIFFTATSLTAKAQTKNVKAFHSFNQRCDTMKTRYFIITYVGNTPQGTATGSMSFTVTNGGFLNNKKCIQQIEEASKIVSSPIITNILEVSEADFKQYYE